MKFKVGDLVEIGQQLCIVINYLDKSKQYECYKFNFNDKNAHNWLGYYWTENQLRKPDEV